MHQLNLPASNQFFFIWNPDTLVAYVLTLWQLAQTTSHFLISSSSFFIETPRFLARYETSLTLISPGL